MTDKKVSMDRLISRIKAHPDIAGAGMILCHNGIVRGSDRSGSRRVEALHVEVADEKIREIHSWAETLPGIVAVAIEALAGNFRVGDDLLFVVVAGDIRENVIDAMRQIVERIKAEGVKKKEIYAD